MSTEPSFTPVWATDPTATKTVISNTARRMGWAIGQILTAGQINAALWNLGQWIQYLRGPRLPYASLETAAAAMDAGDVATVFEDDTATIPGAPLASYFATTNISAMEANSDVVLTTGSTGVVSVRSRATPATVIRTLTRSTTGSAVRLCIYQDYAALAYGSTVDLWQVSTGTRLWSYAHGGAVYDVQICGAYLVLAGAAGTGSYQGRVLNVSAGTVVYNYTHGATLYTCAIYGSVAYFGGMAGTAGGSPTVVAYDVITATSWGVVTSGVGPVSALRTDGRCLYALTDNLILCLSTLDGSEIASAATGVAVPTLWSLAVDHGGAYVATSDGSTGFVGRYNLGNLSLIWTAPLTLATLSAIATDGARVWVANPNPLAAYGLQTYARGNAPSVFVKVDATIANYRRFPWTLIPSEAA